MIELQLDYAQFDCPLGYVFANTNNVSVYAICYNYTYTYTFDPSAFCVRKCMKKPMFSLCVADH